MVARSEVNLQSAFTGTYGNSVATAINDLNTGYGQRMGEITQRRDYQLNQITQSALDIQAGADSSYDRSLKTPSWYAGVSSGLSTYGAVSGVTKGMGDSYRQSTKAVKV